MVVLSIHPSLLNVTTCIVQVVALYPTPAQESGNKATQVATLTFTQHSFSSIVGNQNICRCDVKVEIHGFAESLQHCIRPQSSLTALHVYGSFSALNLPYKEVTEF